MHETGTHKFDPVAQMLWNARPHPAPCTAGGRSPDTLPSERNRPFPGSAQSPFNLIMTLGAFRQWLRTMWSGSTLPAAIPVHAETSDDLDELKSLIETADPGDPQTLEQIAARLGQTDPSQT